MSGAPDPTPPVLRGYRYAPRRIEALEAVPMGRWRVKRTVITVRGRASHFGEVVEAAESAAAGLLDAVPEDGRDAGVAHLLLHLGLGGAWLLVDWWSEGDILMHRHFRAAVDDPTRFGDVAGRHYGPCVWELAVQAHEREAWLRHVLAREGGPDIPAYLADGLTATL